MIFNTLIGACIIDFVHMQTTMDKNHCLHFRNIFTLPKYFCMSSKLCGMQPYPVNVAELTHNRSLSLTNPVCGIFLVTYYTLYPIFASAHLIQKPNL